ncbi:MAG: OsmC family protein [Vicinamibacterales bacterium]
MPDTKPPLGAQLVWSERLRFTATSGRSVMVVDGDGEAGPSPMQVLAFAVAGCMAADVVAILQKGRHPLTGLSVAIAADRAPVHPRRFTHVVLSFEVAGKVPPDAVDRAVTLSRDKYCSALHSLRQDISVEIQTTFTS